MEIWRRVTYVWDLHYTGSMTFSEYSTLNIQFKKFQALSVSTTELG